MKVMGRLREVLKGFLESLLLPVFGAKVPVRVKPNRYSARK